MLLREAHDAPEESTVAESKLMSSEELQFDLGEAGNASLPEARRLSALARVEAYIAALKQEAEGSEKDQRQRAEAAEKERDAAMADNAKVIQRMENTVASLRKAVDEEKAKKRPSQARIMEWMHALVLFEKHVNMANGGPGAALLERIRRLENAVHDLTSDGVCECDDSVGHRCAQCKGRDLIGVTMEPEQ